MSVEPSVVAFFPIRKLVQGCAKETVSNRVNVIINVLIILFIKLKVYRA